MLLCFDLSALFYYCYDNVCVFDMTNTLCVLCFIFVFVLFFVMSSCSFKLVSESVVAKPGSSQQSESSEYKYMPTSDAGGPASATGGGGGTGGA